MAGRVVRRQEDVKNSPKVKRRGFYTQALDEAEQLDFELAAGVEGIDDEIALLRVKIKSLLSNDTADLKHITQATEALARLVKARYSISREQKKGLKEAITNVIRDVAVPLGISVLRQ